MPSTFTTSVHHQPYDLNGAMLFLNPVWWLVVLKRATTIKRRGLDGVRGAEEEPYGDISSVGERAVRQASGGGGGGGVMGKYDGRTRHGGTGAIR